MAAGLLFITILNSILKIPIAAFKGQTVSLLITNPVPDNIFQWNIFSVFCLLTFDE